MRVRYIKFKTVEGKTRTDEGILITPGKVTSHEQDGAFFLGFVICCCAVAVCWETIRHQNWLGDFKVDENLFSGCWSRDWRIICSDCLSAIDGMRSPTIRSVAMQDFAVIFRDGGRPRFAGRGRKYQKYEATDEEE